MDAPLFSIIVPTKNRYFYLKRLLDLIHSFSDTRFEVIIQDNSEDNSGFYDLDKLNDPRMRYFYNPSKITSVQNFDLAIKNSCGKYVCFIGDDDGITRDIMSVVEYMDSQKIDAVRFSRADYYWAGFTKYGNGLSIQNFDGKIYKLEPERELIKMLKKGCQDLSTLPMLYYGIVRRDVLDEVFKICNTYFPGASADIANGAALCFFVKEYVLIKVPYIIPGTSTQTGGGTYDKKSRSLELDKVPFVSKNLVKNWSLFFPRIWHGTIVWPESAIKSLESMGKREYVNYLNIELVLAHFAFEYNNGFQEAYKLSGKKIKFLLYLYMLYIGSIYRRTFNLIIKLMTKNRRLGGYFYTNINSISEAEDLIVSRTHMKSIDLQ